jgi:hypothetical protein
MFVVKKLNKTANWDSISLIDSNGNFRGEAKFESKSDPKAYLKLQKERMNQRLAAVGKAKTRAVKYKVFKMDSKSMMDEKKQKYRFSSPNSLSPLS